MRRMVFILLFAVPFALAMQPAMAEVIAQTTAPLTAPAATEPVYTYQGDKYRDPFIPLSGQGVISLSPSMGEGIEFKPGDMEIRGILKMQGSRWGLIRGNQGNSYVVREGKILDVKRKPVPGYVAIVKEKSVVLIGPNNQVTELKLKEPEAQP